MRPQRPEAEAEAERAPDRGPVPVLPRVRAFRASAFASPDLLCERLRAAGVAGCSLLARRLANGGTTTLVAARGLLRAELRGDKVTITALESAARPLLSALAGRLPRASLAGDRLTAPVPDEHAAPGTPDDEVLRAPSCLDPLRVLARLLADSRPGAPVPPGLLGVFGYELVDRWEELGPRRPDPIDEPDYAFVLVGDAVVYDEASGQVTAVVRGLPWERAQDVDARLGRLEHLGRPDPSRRPGGVPGAAATAIAPSSAARTVEPAAFEPAFGAAVETLLSHIAAGDVYQAVLSRSVALPSTAPPFAVLRALGTDAPFRFFVDLADGALIGASPETCLAVEDGVVELRPLAGTVPRGADADLDQRLAVQLLLDDKEQAEHAMLVDLARNDVARCSLPGSTELSEAFTLLRMSRVQHLASCVRGRLRSGLDALHAYRAVANMGTLTGAPKPMAMALVRGLEPTARGFYGGAIAFLAGDGTLTSCIAIRTLRHVRGQDCYHARAGAGVVHDSVPGNEFLETEHKLAQLRRAVQEALA